MSRYPLTTGLFSYLLLCFTFVTNVSCLINPADITVDTTYGTLKGIDLGESYAFGGIPFGKPPVGPLRFYAPQPPDSWEGIKNADNFQVGCIQNCVEPSNACPTIVSISSTNDFPINDLSFEHIFIKNQIRFLSLNDRKALNHCST